jgi:DNA-3-methyladenine glycosylase
MTTSENPGRQKLPVEFYRRSPVTQIARDLLGTYLCTRNGNRKLTSGMIVETEAYAAQNDKACHASGYNRTERNDAMFRAGGIAYIYLCYGIHHLFNVVTNLEGEPEAVLIRAVKPEEGLDIMLRRRGHSSIQPELTAGPGRLTQALGINQSHYGLDLQSEPIWIEGRGVHVANTEIEATPRIGVQYAGKDAEKPWRFTIAGSQWTSR